mgnify:CR=1 FL=1|jgi:protease IV
MNISSLVKKGFSKIKDNAIVDKLREFKQGYSPNYIGSIVLRGPIYSDDSSSEFDPDVITPDMVETFTYEALDRGVEGLIFDISSPGGGVYPTDYIVDFLKGIDIPKIAFVREMAASGGYWIASACDEIIANRPTSMVGSISVIKSVRNYSKPAKFFGIEEQVFKSGKFKDFGNPFREITKEEIKREQEEIDFLHKYFVESIIENRGFDENGAKVLNDVANGLTYLAGEALNYGLIDGIGSFDSAVMRIQQLCGINSCIVEEYMAVPMTNPNNFDGEILGKKFAKGIIKGLVEYNDSKIKVYKK